MRVSAYTGRPPIHAGNIYLILNLTTGHVSLQFHVVFDEMFSTVLSLKNASVPDFWKFICEKIENSLRTNVSIWKIYGANLIRKVASNLTSKRTQLKNLFNNQNIMH